MTLDKTDPTFVQDLRDSQQYVWVAAKWLQAHGYNVTVPPTYIRPTADERFEYGDQGDLHISKRIEVKHRPELVFTDRESFPYPTIIVDVAHAWDRAREKPHGYIILNKAATHAAIVMADTRFRWIHTTRQDRHAGRVREFYECPTDLVQFVRISQ